MKKQTYNAEGLWLGDRIQRDNPRWDKNLPYCPLSVSKRTLRYLARKRSASTKVVFFPSGAAGIRLHGMIWCGLRDARPVNRPERSRIAASLLMGLAEEGDWTP